MDNKYTVETSEQLRHDILTCVDGFLKYRVLVGDTEFSESLKDALCQIIVDGRKK